MRKCEISIWEESFGGMWDAAIKGSSALRAAVYGTFFDEIHSSEGCHIVTGLVDLEKFYDNIAIPKLLEKAQEQQ